MGLQPGCMGLQPGALARTRFPSGADGEDVTLATFHLAMAKAAGLNKWREMNEQSLAKYKDVEGVVRVEDESGGFTVFIPAQHLEKEITRAVKGGQASTLRPSNHHHQPRNPPHAFHPRTPTTLLHVHGRSLPTTPASPRRRGL